MKLHYSQTMPNGQSFIPKFYYLMKLHYSQTIPIDLRISNEFYYLMKLHYSQTGDDVFIKIDGVLLPYEITLFSNLK